MNARSESIMQSDRRRIKSRAILLVCACLSSGIYAQSPDIQRRSATRPERLLINPLLPSGADPWVTSKDGFYYYMNTTGNNLTVWKTRHIANLNAAEKKVVWTPPSSGPYSHDIWAPELHYLQDRWYIYFAADAGTNKSHRLWVLENSSPDPLQGDWTMKGKLADASDKWAIDGSVFKHQGTLYAIWSGWEGDENGTQSIYIAELKNPWTVKGKRMRISTPGHPWEQVGDLSPRGSPEQNPGANTDDPIHVNVNEGPEVLQHGDKLFLIYSASGCWTNFYELGMMTASTSSNLLQPSSWRKDRLPVFWQSPEAHAYGTGHNGFFKSPDGKQDWIIYHANSEPNQGCGGNRSPRTQPLTWKADGTPEFGRPVPIGKAIPTPSGEQRQ
jgi:GH43 family beta-xylosidase